MQQSISALFHDYSRRVRLYFLRPRPFSVSHSIGQGWHGPAFTSRKTVQEELLRLRATGRCLQEHDVPPTDFREFARYNCWLRPLDLTIELRHSFLLVARFCTHNAPFTSLFTPSCTPYPPWRTEQAIPSPAGSMAHTHALVLQLSLGRFFFFVLTIVKAERIFVFCQNQSCRPCRL